MVLTFTLPQPGEKKRVKDLIIDILAFEWPLTLSIIYRKIKKDYGLGISCQATYKAINELVSEGVLWKNEKSYSINLEWIKKLKSFSSHIEGNYLGQEKLPLIEGVSNTKTENNVTILTFNSVLEMDKTWVNIKKDFYKSLKNDGEITFWEGNHCWWLLVYPEIEFSEIEILKEKKVKDYVIVHNDFPLDKLAKNFYEKADIGFKVMKKPIDCDITVFGDTIMQVYLPKEVREQMDIIYSKARNPSDVDIHDFLGKVLTKKNNVKIILTKNKEIADQLKSKTLSFFNQKV